MDLGSANEISWHSMAGEEALAQLKATEKGLSEAEAQARLRTYGLNQLPREPVPGILKIFLRQFQSPLIYILGIAAIISLAIGELTDAIFIAGVLLINAIIGSYQEWRAEKSSRALERLLRITASVSRDGEPREVDAEVLVPGDMVWLESGNRVPADLRLLMGHGLEIDESALTGESLPVLKNARWKGDAFTPVADRKNMAQAGTTVVRGRGRGVVVATGTQTTIGQLALDVIGIKGGKPPLILRLEKFTRSVGLGVIFAVLIVAIIGVMGKYSLSEMFFFSVALAVSAIPEGLPVAVTVALAMGTNRMARRGVIVRQLAAVEGLGSCNLIASDKTGTLTCNEMTAREIRISPTESIEVTGEGFVPEGRFLQEGKPIDPQQFPELQNLFRAAVLCNEADLRRRNEEWVWKGDPTEIGLLSMALKAGWSREKLLDQYPQVNEIPFEAEHQFAASFHRIDGEMQVFVKGAPERVLTMCQGAGSKLNTEKLNAMALQMAEQGYRVLAFAEGNQADELDATVTPPEPKGLNFLGFVGMIDPLRPGVREAIARCHHAGVKVSMITGDHPVTALAIARDLGFAQSMEQVVTGSDISEVSDLDLRDVISRIRVFSRVAPHEKLRIVEVNQRNNQFVAVTGDGVNDAPALRAANIGVAMGKGGTDVARDAADIVISDDNFATIVSGIEEGRVAYNNVRNVIFLLISTGAAEVFMVALAMIMGMPLPLLPVQLLWLNLVTNGIQDVALALEPGLGNELNQAPRPSKEPIFNRLMLERISVGALFMGGISFAVFYWMINTGWSEAAARNAVLLLMVLFENIHLWNSRSETRSAFALSPFRSPLLLFGTLIAFSVHLAVLYLPIGHQLLRTQPVSMETWVLLVGLASTILLAMEVHKLIWYLRHRGSVR